MWERVLKASISARECGRKHKAWGGKPQDCSREDHKSHNVGDSLPAAARFTGLGAFCGRFPGFRLRLHPGLYAAARFTGWKRTFKTRSESISERKADGFDVVGLPVSLQRRQPDAT